MEFSSATLGGAQVIIDLGTAAATALVDAFSADNRPGCPEYHSLTNTGSTQQVKLVQSIPTPNSIDRGTAGLLSISNGGPSVNAYTFLLRKSGRVDFTILLAGSRLSQRFVASFMQLLAQKLSTSLAAG